MKSLFPVTTGWGFSGYSDLIYVAAAWDPPSWEVSGSIQCGFILTWFPHKAYSRFREWWRPQIFLGGSINPQQWLTLNLALSSPSERGEKRSSSFCVVCQDGAQRSAAENARGAGETHLLHHRSTRGTRARLRAWHGELPSQALLLSRTQSSSLVKDTPHGKTPYIPPILEGRDPQILWPFPVVHTMDHTWPGEAPGASHTGVIIEEEEMGTACPALALFTQQKGELSTGT